jgi:hypothetical protein
MIPKDRLGRRMVGVTLALAALVLAVSPAVAFGAPGGDRPNGHGHVPHRGQGPGQQQAGSAHGIVQSVAPRAVVLKELDGSTVSVPVAPSTRVFVNGARAALGAVEPGFVASASWRTGRPASELQTFDPSASIAVVQSVSASAVVVTDSGGSTITIHVAPRTRVLVDGKPAPLSAVAPGDELVAGPGGPGGRPASELRFLRPG